MINAKKWLIAVILVSLVPASALGQNNQPVSPLELQVGKAASSAFYRMLTDSTESFNRVLFEYIIDTSGLSLLKDLKLRFRTFRSVEDSTKTSLGFSYSYAHDVIRNIVSAHSNRSLGFSASILAEGNVAFVARDNPEDFLCTRLSIHAFRSSGGTLKKSDPATWTLLNNLGSSLIAMDNEEDIDTSSAWKQFSSIVQQSMTTQVYFDLAMTGGLEANQDFTRKQWTYGGQLGFDLKAWNRSSTLALFNIFDWIPALTRVLTGLDDQISPSGSSIPTLLLALEEVDPVKDSLRFSITQSEAVYSRFRCEVAMRTRISRFSDLTADARYYRVLNASDALKKSNLNEFPYLTMAILTSNGFYFSYSTGRLPFDDSSDQVYGIGFQYNFH
jgi:hypothetical protein